MHTRFSLSILLTVLVVVAGCGAPVATDTPGAGGSPVETPAQSSAPTTVAETETPPSPATETHTATLAPETTAPPTTSEPAVAPWSKVTVRGGNFSFDEAQVYRRVVRLHGLNLSEVPDVTVYIRNRSEYKLSQIYQPSAFEEAMGITVASGKTAIAGLASGNRVWVYQDVLKTAAQREAVLAHEYAHVIQTKLQGQQRTSKNVHGRLTQEGRVETGVIEGASMFVEHQYRVKYLDAEDRLTTWKAARANRTAFGAFLVAPYVFGQQYIDNEIDEVTDLDQIYDSPPQTTEQVLHNLDPGEEPALELSVTTTTRDSDWRVVARRTKGELFARLVLERQLSVDRAEGAAAGWGADRLVTFERDGADGFAWTLRWDSASEASEFEEALRDYLDARGEKSDGIWTADGTAFRIVEVNDETVTLLVGAETFVENAAVSGSDDEVDVDPDG